MAITAAQVKALRDETSAGVMECKRALEEAGGDVAAARDLLREWGLARAASKIGREVRHGLVESYIHAGGRIGVLLELNCETDFVARTEEFRQLAHDLAMQVAATNPRFVRRDELSAEQESEATELCLLAQPYIRDTGRPVEEVVHEAMARFGENVEVRRFVRFELGA